MKSILRLVIAHLNAERVSDLARLGSAALAVDVCYF
jgi:hypothetical protein